ncbi:MAG: DUF308 domain-containing protein [Christensenellales bacterium]
MQTAKTTTWWFTMIIGLIILLTGVFLIAWPLAGLGALTFLLGSGILGFGIYNIFMAVKTTDDNRLFIPFLVHGLLNFIMFLLVIIIHNSPAHLGALLGSWFIVFGTFRIIYARQDAEKKLSARVGVFLFLIGAALLVLPFVIGIDHVLFLGITAIVIGAARAGLSILKKVRSDEAGGGRADLR